MRQTHTYALLEISAEAYDEIAGKLRAAGYGHAFGSKGEIDMHGIAVTRGERAESAIIPALDVAPTKEQTV